MSVGKLLETLRRKYFNISEYSCSCECVHNCLFFFNQTLFERTHVDGKEVDASVKLFACTLFSDVMNKQLPPPLLL